MADLKKLSLLIAILVSLAGCGGNSGVYHDKNMDFGAIHTVAILPFGSLEGGGTAAEMVRDDFMGSLLATGAIYVIPSGEVAHGIGITGMQSPMAPSTDEVKKFCSLEKADAVITGIVKEYGQVRNGSAESDKIAVSIQMIEGQTGRIVWSADVTKGGITVMDRLFGGGAEPMNVITQKAVNDLIKKLFM
ncbi:MAG: hypothetical protein M0Z61_13785 [Nitrospiraceae bacterium]|nr:hypothetical protein [Nitrospiraceae bacterium]